MKKSMIIMTAIGLFVLGTYQVFADDESTQVSDSSQTTNNNSIIKADQNTPTNS